MPNKKEFSGECVLVTGAAQGIGEACVKKLLSEDATVIASDVQFQHRMEKIAPNHFRVHLDVTRREQVEELVNILDSTMGGISCLVNVAGVLHMGKLLELEESDWLNSLQVNCTGVFNVCQYVGRSMVAGNKGSIVVVGSNAATVPRMSMGAYAASKAAATQMLKCLALELAEHNIRCNLVAPGSTDTLMQRQVWSEDCRNSGQVPEKIITGDLESYRNGIPLRKIAKAQEVAEVVAFLLSRKASHITMENILIDGGATLGC